LTPTPTARKPQLKAAVEVVPASDGRIYLLRGELAGDLAVEDTPFARELLVQLAVGDPIEALSERVSADFPGVAPDDVRASVAQLAELGVVDDAADDELLSDSQRERYDRQLRYFGELMPIGASRAAYQRRLGEARVVVIGVGGLGSWAAYGLACAGIGSLTLVDCDEVEPSNLNRQILYTPADVGRPKAVAAAERLAAFVPESEVRSRVMRVESTGDVSGLIEGADLLVDAADWPARDIDLWVNEACFSAGIPYTSMGQLPPLIRLGPTYVPGETGCYACREAAYRDSHPMYDELVTAKGLAPTPAPTFGPACGIIGSNAAMEAVHALTGICPPSTLGRAVMIDLRSWEVSTEAVPRDPACPVCG
jgi:molybdopterin/thiamine biosynthesis adenylyltransferase